MFNLLLVLSVLGTYPPLQVLDGDPTPAILIAVAAELAEDPEGEARSVTVEPRWLDPFPVPIPDTAMNLDLALSGKERIGGPLLTALRTDLPGVELCEEPPGENRCIQSAGTAHITFAHPRIDEDLARVQVLVWRRVAPERSLTSFEIWDFTLRIDGDRASIESRERIIRGHGRLRTP